MNNLNPHDCPYIGLRAFEREETHLFFGRETQTDTLIDKLRAHHFLTVTGTSGCGKSSLVKTGLISGLESGYMRQAGANWIIADLRPGNSPYHCLATALLDDPQFATAWQQYTREEEPQRLQSHLQSSLQRGSRSVCELLDELQQADCLAADAQLLILVDQFEEIFRYRQKNENEAAAFIALLLETLKQKNAYIVITMRSDFLGKAAEFSGLPEIINQSLFLTPRLTREQLADAIRLPAQVYGGEVEAALLNQLLNEASNEPDQLPLLQHALMRHWQQDDDKILTLAEYQQQKGLKGSLNDHADQAFEELKTDERKAIAETLFKALTERSNDNQDIRRPTTLGEIAKLADTSTEAVADVVNLFRQAGRNFLTPAQGDLTADTIIDISHESLIRQWDKLQGWVKAEAESARDYRRLDDAAQQYQQGNGAYLVSPTLDNALQWQQNQQPNQHWAKRYGGDYPQANEFLQQSHKAQKRQKLSKRILWTVLFISLSLLAAQSWVGKKQAEAQQQIAQQAAEKAKQARDEAEQLISFMSIDLRDKLEPIDRLDILKDVQERVSDYYERMGVETESGKSLYQRAINYANQGDRLFAEGKLGAAFKLYTKYHHAIQKLVEKNKDNTNYQRELSVYYNKLGDIYNAQGQLDKALEQYQQSLKIRKSLADSDPSNAGWQRDLSVSYYKLSTLEEANNQLKKSLENAKKSYQILKKLDDEGKVYGADKAWLVYAKERIERLKNN